MRHAATLALLVATLTASAGDATLHIAGIDEQGFNPRRVQFSARLDGARIDGADDAVSLLINGEPIDSDRLTVRDRTLTVDAEFDDGVNDVLVLARTRAGDMLRADALVWAGDNVLVVDVVDEDTHPVDRAEVKVSLASNTTTSVSAATSSGTARFEHLPSARLFVQAVTPDGRRASSATPGDAGSLLLVLRAD